MPILVVNILKLLSTECVRWYCELAVVLVVKHSKLTRGAVEHEGEWIGGVTNCLLDLTYLDVELRA